MYNKVKDYKDLVKDPKTGAILLSNQKVANDYSVRKKELQHDVMVEREINSIKSKLEEMDSVKKDLHEIKSLLKELVTK